MVKIKSLKSVKTLTIAARKGKKQLFKRGGVGILAFIVAVTGASWLTWGQQAFAANGVFTIDVVRQQASYPSGSVVLFDINYQCSVIDEGDSCDNIFITMERPAGLTTNSSIVGSSHTTHHQFDGNTAVWELQESIPGGTSGRVTVGWLNPDFITPNGTVITATGNAREGSATGNVVDTDDDSSTITATVGGVAATKISSTNTFINGNNVTYTIRVQRTGVTQPTGNLALGSVTVTDVLPEGVEWVGPASNGGQYDSGTNTVTWNNIPVSQANQTSGNYFTETVVVKVVGQPSDIVTNTASYTGYGLGSSPLDETPDVHTGSAMDTDTIAPTPPPASGFRLEKDGLGRTVPSTVDPLDIDPLFTPGEMEWTLTMVDQSSNGYTGVVTDVIPCLDPLNGSSISSSSDPTALCLVPSVNVNTLDISYDAPNSSIGLLTWWTNTGNTALSTLQLLQISPD